MKNLFLILCVLFFFFFVQKIIANADTLVIQGDGKVILVLADNGVLGESVTSAPKEPAKPPMPDQQSNPPKENSTQPQSAPPQPQHAEDKPQAPAKTVPLTPPHTENTVQINPPINDGRKMQVTITTNTAVQQASPPTTKTITQPTLPSGNTARPATPATNTIKTNTIKEAVDEVVAQSANGKPVLSIKSEKANQLTIQQGKTQVKTNLSLQINTFNHSLSIFTPTSPAVPVFVLPSEAIQGIANKGLLDTKSLNGATINLTRDTNGINYTVNSKKQGKLFGVFSVKLPIQVKLSAQSGKIINTSQSLLYNIFGGLIK